MKIKQHYERKNPEDNQSQITNRGLEFETYLKPECIHRIALKTGFAEQITINDKIRIMGVLDGKTRFRTSLYDAGSNKYFAWFLYGIMNWEGNSMHWNEGQR